jgi:hypothetical protein
VKLKNLKECLALNKGGDAFNVIIWLKGNSVPIQSPHVKLIKRWWRKPVLNFSGHDGALLAGKRGCVEIEEIQAIAGRI